MLGKLEALKKLLDNCERDTNGCLIYKGGLDKDGYGKIRVAKDTFVTHRLMLYLMGEIKLSDERLAAHKNICKSKACCEPDHLYAASAEQNTRDAIEAGFKPWEQANINRRNKTHCVRGHEFTKSNTGKDRYGNRFCRECQKAIYRKK